MELQAAKSKRTRKVDDLGGMDGIDYARGVLSGKILVSELTRKTFERHRADLAASKRADFPYVFKPEAGAKVLRFLELHPHVQGDLAGQLFKPEPWQRAMISILHGWRVKGDEKRRRFRRASVFVPRGNGKTYIGSGLANYHSFADGNPGSASFSFAVTKDQARLSWTASQAMLRHERMAPVRTKLGIQVGQHSIFQPGSNAFFKALASESDSLDGLNVTGLGLGDEVAAHPSRDLFDVIATATAKASTSLLLTISTASGNTSSIGKELWDHGVKVLNGTLEDPGFFFLAYECPADLLDVALTSEKAWKAANPNFGVSVQPDVFAQLAENARQNPSARAAFLTKMLNVWVSADAAYYDLQDFDACVDRGDSVENHAGSVAYAGLDLASKLDLACAAYVVPFEQDGVTHYAAWVDSFLNEDAARDSKNVNYSRWAENGSLIVTPGGVTDYSTIEQSVLEVGQKVALQSVSFDAWQGQYFAQRLEAAGLLPVETRMTTAFLSTPMKELASLMRQRRIHFIGPTDVLRFCVGNVVSKDDVRGNPYPRKERPEAKIDAVTALLLALGRALVAPPPAGSDFLVV
jgi:phage terminase large subunit-like protein